MNNINNIIQTISSGIIALFTIFLWLATKEQKNIAQQEKNLNLFKLRMEHYNKFIELWSLYSSYFSDDGTKCKTVYNYKTLDDRKLDFQRIKNELIILENETEFLFSKDIFNIEHQFLDYFIKLYKNSDNDDVLATSYVKNKLIYGNLINTITPILSVGVENAK